MHLLKIPTHSNKLEADWYLFMMRLAYEDIPGWEYKLVFVLTILTVDWKHQQLASPFCLVQNRPLIVFPKKAPFLKPTCVTVCVPGLNLHPRYDVTHSSKHAIVFKEKYFQGRGMQSCFLCSVVAQQWPSPWNSRWFSVQLSSEDVEKNGWEKRKGGEEKITLHTMENRQFCGFVGSQTMGGQMWMLHKTWAIRVMMSSRLNMMKICMFVR